VIEIHACEKRLCELVDGVLVEKSVGLQESYLAVLIARLIGAFVDEHNLGLVLGADGMAKLAPGLIRIPDVSFISWDHYPDKRIPALPFVPFGPNLAIEVLSPSNPAKEMSRKLVDYFEAGVSLVLYVDPVPRTVDVFTSPDRSVVLGEGDTLDGGTVLPGFALAISRLFVELEPKPAG
jgi:Uma2 family endonuclease